MGRGWALVGLMGLAGCGEEEVSVAEPVAAPAPVSGRIVATMNQLGGIGLDTPPTVVGVMGALGEGWSARTGTGGVVEAVRGGEVVLTVHAAVNGTQIERVFSHHPDVVFPWNLRVGDRMGAHKNWDRMACRVGERGVDGALCHAFEDSRFGYVVRGWVGDVATLPPKEVAAELTVAELVWMPLRRGR